MVNSSHHLTINTITAPLPLSPPALSTNNSLHHLLRFGYCASSINIVEHINQNMVIHPLCKLPSLC